MSRKGATQKDPPLTKRRIQEGRRLLRWSRTLESHGLGSEEWLRQHTKGRCGK